MQTTTQMPTIHITNYQQYINADYLADRILDHIPADAMLPENIYASIAYIMVDVKAAIYTTALVLSIKGKAYRFKLCHKDQAAYNAWVNGLELKSTRSQNDKDADIRLLQQAFEAVVNKNIKQITKAITCAYGNK